ncbi:uncharacterized protein LOC114352459 [Ostrinia furnacalis]|uniref:uncharacterized protein LOC114352459 n=1 Tax=Ostrinia furnacalis TaxID=93504 RepID=UPI00103ABAD7|nr:uncharacterized protein LOC114352459 [Ostrinia furnacalis]
MRPAHVTCALEDGGMKICVWEAGHVLVARDHWGRWQLLGVGLNGPGCGAPGRYLDMMTYWPWVVASLGKFRRLTISKINQHKFVLRSAGSGAYQRFGACDPEEKINLVYREVIVLRTDNDQYQFMTYNMSVYENVEYSCLTLELVNASAVSEMKVRHTCVRESYGPACYAYRGSVFDISVYMMFSDKCRFEMFAWGWKKNLSLIDIQDWKWEEGTYYEDFSMTRVEYRGPADQTEYGFEPIDERLWVPEYDYWTTTEFDNSTTTVAPTTPQMTAEPDWGKEYNVQEDQPLDKFIFESTEPESEFLLGIRW